MLADRGVLDRFAPRLGGGGDLIEHVVMGIDAGPAGSGCIVAIGAQTPVYAPDRQAWIEGPKFWVGIEDAPPRPEELARELGIAGYETLLSDGCVWRVPLLRRWDGQGHVINLPQAMIPVINGKAGIKVRPEYQAINALAETVFADFIEEKTLPLDTVLAEASAILAVNYRIGTEEIGLLGLLDETTAVRILSLSIDLPAIEEQVRRLATQGLEYVDPVIEEE